MGFDAQIQRAITQTYERWDGKGVPNGLKGEEIALPMRVSQVVLDAEAFHRTGA